MSQIHIQSGAPLVGQCSVPGDKSISHRAVMFASIAEGQSHIHNFLDGYWDELCYYHCPTANVPNMDGDWVARLSSMDIAIVTGETDNILSGTTNMLRILNEKGIRNRGSVWNSPYGHDWPWWKVQIRSYVP